MPFVSRQPRPRRTPQPVEKAAPLNALEQAIQRAYTEAVRQFAAGINTPIVADAIRQSIEATLRALPTGSIIGDLQPIADAIVREIIRAGREETRAVSRSVGFNLRFDEADPRAVAWAQQRAGELVKGVTDEVEQVIRETVTDAIDGRISVQQAQRRIQRVIGLHPRWQKAVDNTYARLIKQNLASGMTEEQATRAAQLASEKYQQRLIRARAKNIARTEVATAQNEGRWQAWQQAADDRIVNIQTAMKEWRTAPEFVSSRTQVCPICLPLDGKRIPVNENFQTGLRSQPDGIKMPPAHPSCRCRAVLITPSFSEIERRVLEARERERQQAGQR